MNEESQHKEAKSYKISRRLMILVLASVFCVVTSSPISIASDLPFLQTSEARGNSSLQGQLFGSLTSTSMNVLRTASKLSNAVHYATICAFIFQFSRPSLPQPIEASQISFPASMSLDSVLKVRSPPSIPSFGSAL